MNSFAPDPTAGNAEKDSPEYGLKIGRFIESEWSDPRIQERRARMQHLRSHMEGTVDASHLKPLLTKGKDLSAMRVNWTYHSEVPRMVNSVVEGFSYDKYRTQVKGVDAHSQDKRSQFRREKLKAMAIKDEASQLSDLMGMDFRPGGFVPNSKEELNMYMELEYKQAQEIAAELGVQKTFDFGEWRETFNHIAEDLALMRIGAAKVIPDPQTALRFEYVDPESFIYSRNVEKNRNYSEAYYFGQFIRMTVAEFERITEGQIDAEKLKQLASRFGYNLHQWHEMSEQDKDMSIDVIRFAYKTNRYDIKKKKYNKHGGYKYIDKDDYFEPHEKMRSEVVRLPYEVWYEGMYIPGTEIVVNYGLMDNMMRDPRNKRKAIPPYVMYRLSSEAVGEQIAEICDDLYITKIKLRQLTLKLKPKGYAIDIDGLGDLDMPDGSTLSTIDRVRIMREDGDLLYSGQSLIDDMQNPRSPIHDLPDATGRELGELLNVYNHHMQRLHDITGINPQASGAAPPSRTSSDVYQGTLAASQRVVNNIFNGLLSIQKRASEAILSRLHSASVMDEMGDIVENILGEYTTDRIREMANLKYYQFIVNIDLRPTDEERRELIQNLAEALQTGAIAIEDKIDIEEIENLRLAKQVIKMRQKERKEEQQRLAQQEHQRQMEQTQANEQARLQREQYMAEIENQKTMAEYELKAKLQTTEAQAKLREISLKGQWDMAVEREKARSEHSETKYKQDRTDQRQNMANTQQSELIEQRQRQTPPKNFEQSDDSEIDQFEGLTPYL